MEHFVVASVSLLSMEAWMLSQKLFFIQVIFYLLEKSFHYLHSPFERERALVKMSGFRSTSNVRSGADAGLWSGVGEQGSSTRSKGCAAKRTYAAVRERIPGRHAA